ncbi:hypothetical protein KDAU_41720 [Dictyobacter aurantiacus]|uniref:Uncharacterized protein n=1 Tax=Dictyobacter aurantiacus TaxID=1936993 RepID=A0A401ZJ23_9CHLR|nr:hypothetical protein KDAU_41720 [Dictyobacter aurantiacus]
MLLTCGLHAFSHLRCSTVMFMLVRQGRIRVPWRTNINYKRGRLCAFSHLHGPTVMFMLVRQGRIRAPDAPT